jgi:hypothetical protein
MKLYVAPTARERLDGALDRVTVMERYVTSRRYELNQKFSKLW